MFLHNSICIRLAWSIAYIAFRLCSDSEMSGYSKNNVREYGLIKAGQHTSVLFLHLQQL